jgi:hypothetical protein
LCHRFGRNEAIQRVAADTLKETEVTDTAIKRYDKELQEAKRKARRRVRKTRADDAGKTQWNAQHPEESPKPFLDEPYVPQQPEVGIDLSTRIADFVGVQAQALSLREITDALTKLEPEHGFAPENITQVYLYYRLISAASVHPTLHLYDSYFEPPRGHFVHTADLPTGDPVIHRTWATALYATHFTSDEYCTTLTSHARAMPHRGRATRPRPARPRQHQRMTRQR